MILVIACVASVSVARGFLYFSILDRTKGRIRAKNEGNRGEERREIKFLPMNPMTLKNLFAWLEWHSNFD